MTSPATLWKDGMEMPAVTPEIPQTIFTMLWRAGIILAATAAIRASIQDFREIRARARDPR